MGNKCPPINVREDFRGKFFHHWVRYGKLNPDWKFPNAIPIRRERTQKENQDHVALHRIICHRERPKKTITSICQVKEMHLCLYICSMGQLGHD
jgi:hypothetical protein